MSRAQSCMMHCFIHRKRNEYAILTYFDLMLYSIFASFSFSRRIDGTTNNMIIRFMLLCYVVLNVVCMPICILVTELLADCGFSLNVYVEWYREGMMGSMYQHVYMFNTSSARSKLKHITHAPESLKCVQSHLSGRTCIIDMFRVCGVCVLNGLFL